MRLSYNRCKKFHAPVDLNYEALSDLMTHLELLLKQGYELLSMDETGFGSACLKKYSWVKTGQAEVPIFKKQSNLTLLGAISSRRVEAFQLIEGGNNEEWMTDFCEKLSQERLDNQVEVNPLEPDQGPKEKYKKMIILLDNASCHRTNTI